jgi:hypothetical protein
LPRQGLWHRRGIGRQGLLWQDRLQPLSTRNIHPYCSTHHLYNWKLECYLYATERRQYSRFTVLGSGLGTEKPFSSTSGCKFTISYPRIHSLGSSPSNVSFAHNDEILTATGFVVDTIATVSEPLYVYGPESDVLPTLEKFHNWWNIFIDNVGFTRQDLEVFQRTFCGGAWAPSYSEGEFKEDQTQRLTLFFGLTQRLLPHLIAKGSPIPPSTPTDPVDDEILERQELAMVSSAALRMHAKRLIISERKLAGLAPQLAEVGDKIVVFMGCNFPVVLREVDDRCELIGEIYVDGIMDGEAMDDLKAGKYRERTFEIH